MSKNLEASGANTSPEVELEDLTVRGTFVFSQEVKQLASGPLAWDRLDKKLIKAIHEDDIDTAALFIPLLPRANTTIQLSEIVKILDEEEEFGLINTVYEYRLQIRLRDLLEKELKRYES